MSGHTVARLSDYIVVLRGAGGQRGRGDGGFIERDSLECRRGGGLL